MAKLPLSPDTEDKAFLFARANIAAGEFDEAIRWVTPPEPEPEPAAPEPTLEEIGPAPEDAEASGPANLLVPTGITIETGGPPEDTDAEEASDELLAEGEMLPDEEDPVAEPPTFEAAWIGALVILADADARKDAIEAAADQLIAAAQNEEKAEAAARMFALWSAAGTAPPSEARTFLSIESPTADSSSAPGDAIAIWAAARSGTAAEVVLRTVSLTNGDPSELGLADIMLILAALEDIGAGDAARLLALEATGYWKETP